MALFIQKQDWPGNIRQLQMIDHHQATAILDISGNIGLGSQERLPEELAAIKQQRFAINPSWK